MKHNFNHIINQPIEAEIHVADNLVSLRKLEQLTQEELAGKCGVTKNTISSIERNEFLPSLTLIVKLCLALNCRLGDLIEVYSYETEDNIYL